MDSKVLHFDPVDSAEELLEVITPRLPRSAHVFNMLKMASSFHTEMSFYRLKTGPSRDSDWILARYEREDVGQQFAISVPNDLGDNGQLDDSIQEVFETISPEVIDWNQQFEFIGLDLMIMELVFKISIKNGNLTEVLPCQFFYFPRDKPILKDEDSLTTDEYELRSLNSTAGVQYLLSPHWKDHNENTKPYRIKCVERCLSVGAYKTDTGEVVSGAMVNPTGHIGIVTLDEFQRQGLGHACFQTLLEFLLKETTLVPCSMVYLKNESSLRLHEKGGHRATYPCYFVFYKGG